MAETVGMHPLGEKLLPFDEARTLLYEHLAPTLRTETVALVDAHGRVAASAIRAPADVPAFDRSAMDGYAVRAADTQRAEAGAPVGLTLVGAAHAGVPFEGKLRPGECLQIATGAPMPAGADAVVMVERTRRSGDQVWLGDPLRSGENVSVRGGDIRRGDVAVAHESSLTPARLAVLAALGITKVNVYVRPIVAILSTGTELREPGAALAPGQIYDSNSTALATLVASTGARVERSPILPDEPNILRGALQRFRGCDLILVTGSSSAGEHDYLAGTVRNIGSITFHGVAVKPGKPLLLARIFAKPLVGLAGNPASCLLMSYALVVPALRRFQHQPPDAERKVRARLGHTLTSPRGRRHFVPVRVHHGVADSVYKDSDATTSLAAADGYIEIPDEAERLDEGTVVVVHLF